MSKDFYEILGLDRSASITDVKKRYRTLALKLHPQSSSGSPQTYDEFNAISEAYTVLSNPEHRAVFDVFGEDGLKKGVPDGVGGMKEGWQNSLTSEEIFSEFFGTAEPIRASHLQHVFDPSSREHEKTVRSETIKLRIYFTLEQLYTGLSKYVPITRRTLNDDNTTTHSEKINLKICIRAGTSEGTKFTFIGKGHHDNANEMIGDVEIEIGEAPHPRFERNGTNLIYTHRLLMAEALTGAIVPVVLLDGRVLNVAVHEVIHPNFTKTLKGVGMPSIDGTNDGPGDVIVKFQVDFPHTLSIQKKEAIRKLLPAH